MERRDRAICLNMIVKNEAPVIERCLSSARGLIDRWVIVDTGSTDDTREIIRRVLHDLPGELHERPWRDFAHNRNEALALASDRAGYILFIDADEVFDAPTAFRWPALGAAAYYLSVLYAGVEYQRCALISTARKWTWRGVLHEYLEAEADVHIDRLAAPVIHVSHDGARARDPQTFRRDIEVLERALAAEPGNARYAFYLAQSYRDAGEPGRSLSAYERRAAMTGWVEETWYSLYQAALLAERLNEPAEKISARYLKAWQFRPTRAEPLVQLSRYHRGRGEPATAYIYASMAAATPLPSDLLFVERSFYDWGALDEVGATAFYAGQMAAGRAAVERLLAEKKIPDVHVSRLKDNLAFYGGS